MVQQLRKSQSVLVLLDKVTQGPQSNNAQQAEEMADVGERREPS